MARNRYSKIVEKCNKAVATANEIAESARFDSVVAILEDAPDEDKVSICTWILASVVASCCRCERDKVMVDMLKVISDAADEHVRIDTEILVGTTRLTSALH